LNRVEIFTDGACRGNPGPGGWGALIRREGEEIKLYGGQARTTNNRMELTAAIEALSSINDSNTPVDLTSDSEYLRKGITEWIGNWKKRNWKTAAGKPVKNQDLWRQLDAIAGALDVRWHWVKGHSGHRENEIADQLANLAIDEMLEVT
jgi:ribonuclease HI